LHCGVNNTSDYLQVQPYETFPKFYNCL